ncbi:MAG TPA: lipase secretion chaperone [Moraxellaceae bacterium]|nr:lipase secretion chaperone [Moraxellaceae bacterium]
MSFSGGFGRPFFYIFPASTAGNLQSGIPMKRKVPWIILLVLAIAGAAYFGSGAGIMGEVMVTGDSAKSATNDASANSTPPRSFHTGLEGLPGSLAGTEVDGSFEVDATGHLRINKGIRQTFDYFLSAVGEESISTIMARIRAYIRNRLKEPAASEAEAILAGYAAYKQALDALPRMPSQADGGLNLDAIQRQMTQVQSLRAQYLDPEVVRAFFGDEDAYDLYTVNRLQVLQSKELTDKQRAQQLALLQQQLPPAMQQSLKVADSVQDLNALTEIWKKRGGTAQELRDIREALVGADAADRLEALDSENTDWERRMKDWLSQRDALLATTGLSESDRQAQIAQLRSKLFSAEELLRVQALEGLRDRSSQSKSAP